MICSMESLHRDFIGFRLNAFISGQQGEQTVLVIERIFRKHRSVSGYLTGGEIRISGYTTALAQ